MSDWDIRLAQTRFEADPTRPHLLNYMLVLHRHGLLTEQLLIDLLGFLYPVEMHPWWRSPGWGSPDISYNEVLHRNILTMMARIHPRQAFIDIISNWPNINRLSECLYMMWQVLLDNQFNEIITDQDRQNNTHEVVDDYYGNYYQEVDEDSLNLLARMRGLARLPITVWLDLKPFDLQTEDPEIIVTAIMDGDFTQPTTVTEAHRCHCYAEQTECYPDSWMQRGDTYRWIENGPQAGSFTLIPYREFCQEHQRDLIGCVCEACGTVGHICNCKKCEGALVPNEYGQGNVRRVGCKKYHNRIEPQDTLEGLEQFPIKPEMRCECFDPCLACGSEANIYCSCHKCSYCKLYQSRDIELPDEIRCRCYDLCPTCGKKRYPLEAKYKPPHSCSCHLKFETSDPEFNALCYSLRERTLNYEAEADDQLIHDVYEFYKHLLYIGDFDHESVRDLSSQILSSSGPIGKAHRRRLWAAYVKASEESPIFTRGYGNPHSGQPNFKIPLGGGGIFTNNYLGAKIENHIKISASLWIPVYMENDERTFNEKVRDPRTLNEIGEWLANYFSKDGYMKIQGKWRLSEVGDPYDKDTESTITLSHPGGRGAGGEAVLRWYLGLG